MLARAAESAAERDIRVVPASEADVTIVVQRAGALHEESLTRRDDLDDVRQRPTLVLLEGMDVDVARDAYAAGASGVLSIDSTEEELVAAVRSIAAGLVVIHPAIASDLIAAPAALSIDAPIDAPPPASLTPREREVLALLARGLANKMIAARLGISEHTVKTHIAATYEKLDARNRAEAVVAAARQGLITL